LDESSLDKRPPTVRRPNTGLSLGTTLRYEAIFVSMLLSYLMQ
jgi:hypothetical protein